MQAVYLPVPAAAAQPGGHLALVDYRRKVATSTPADATGAATATLPGPDAGYFWLIQRMTVACTSTAPSSAAVYAGSIAPAYLLDTTEQGDADVADEASVILLDSTQDLICQWTGATAGAVGTLTVQFQLVQRTDT